PVVKRTGRVVRGGKLYVFTVLRREDSARRYSDRNAGGNQFWDAWPARVRKQCLTGIRTDYNNTRVVQSRAAIVEPSALAGCRQQIRSGELPGLRLGPARAC